MTYCRLSHHRFGLTLLGLPQPSRTLGTSQSCDSRTAMAGGLAASRPPRESVTFTHQSPPQLKLALPAITTTSADSSHPRTKDHRRDLLRLRTHQYTRALTK